MTDQELKDLVANLAISQNRNTENLLIFNDSLRELKESIIEDRKSIIEDRKSIIEDRKSITELKEAIIEDRKSITELKEAIIEDRKSITELKEAIKEDRKTIIEDRKSITELKESIKESRYQQKESDQKFEKQSLILFEKIKKLQRSMRDLRKLGLSVGFETEEFFYESFNQYPVLGKYKFDIVSHHVKGQKAEFDIVLYNSKQIGIVEVKNRLRRNRLKEFVNKLPLFRKEFPQYNYFRIIAAVASYSFEQESDQLAKSMGVYVFSRYGQKLKPLHGESFTAKEF